MPEEPKATWAERLLFSRRPPAATADTRFTSGLALDQVHENLVISGTGQVTAWYLAGQQRWSFRTMADRNAVLAAHATRLSELIGRRVHTRVTHRPYPVTRWAEALHHTAVAPLPGWPEYLEEEQRKVARLPLDDKLVFYGVRLGRFSVLARSASRFSSRAGTRQLRALERDRASVDRTMAAAGFSAVPAGPADMDWLMTRSLGLCLPAPALPAVQPNGRWGREDLAEWVDGIAWSAEPFAHHVRVSGFRNNTQVERYVSVLTLGRMELLPVPEGQGPWLQRLDRLPFPYEVAMTCDVRAAEEVEKEVRNQLSRIKHQVQHHHEHGEEEPIALERQNALGREIEDELRTGFNGTSTRVKAWVRIAVAGRTPDEVQERVEAVTKLYSPSVVVHRGIDQYAMAREFIPGEPLANDAHVRRMPVTTMAGALPAATAEVGDRVGPNLGYTSGISRRAVMWHPFLAQEQRERSGLTPVLGTLGAGKSTLGGKICYDSVRMGVPWIVLDPSGPLTKLAGLPELRAFSQVINLTDAEPGTLNPYRIVPDPRREHYLATDYADRPFPEEAAQRAWQADVKKASATRTTLALDVLRGMLPQQLADDRETQKVLLKAGRAVQSEAEQNPAAGGTSALSPHDLIRHLIKDGREHATDIAEFLQQAAEMPQGQLIFPSADGGDDAYKTRNWRLTVMSLRGIVLPQPGTARGEWSTEESYSVSLLYLAGWYAQRAIYDRPMHERKGLWLDESHVLAAVSSGRELLRKTGRDSRKHRVRCLYCTQNGQDILSAGVGDWVEEVFVGRTVGIDAQRAALQLLNVDQGHGYEQVLEGLSPLDRRSDDRLGNREFIFADGNGGIERITVTLEGRPGLLNVLSPTSNPALARPENPWTQPGVLTLAKGER